MQLVHPQNYLVFGILFFLVIAMIPVFAEDESQKEEKMSEQQKKEFEKTMKQLEREKEIAKKQAENEHESEDDDNRGFFNIGGNTSGLILTGTIASILGVIGYAGYRIFSIRRTARAKRKATLEGLSK